MKITIDGDTFRSVLLSNDEWHCLVHDFKELIEAEQFVTEFVTVLSCQDPNMLGFSRVGVVEGPGIPRVLVVSKDTYNDNIGWRPVLAPEIPFAKKDMPDGTTVTGGSLYVTLPNQPESCVNRPSIYKASKHVESSEYRIGDTGSPEQALEWVVWGGYLVCTQVLLTNIPIRAFNKAKLV